MPDDVVVRDLGSVIGPQGPQGPAGPTYELTEQDRENIAAIVGDDNYLPLCILNVDVYNATASRYPDTVVYVPATVTLKDSAGTVIGTRQASSQRISYKLPPYSVYKVSVEATGYESAAEQTIAVQPGNNLAAFGLTPTAEIYYEVVWKSGDTILYSENVQPHANSVYQGADPTKEGEIWTGWDGDGKDIIAPTVINATFVTPTVPETPVDTSLYDYVYSDDPTDSMAYTFGEFVGIINAGLAGTYFRMYDRIKIVNTGSAVNDASFVLSLHSLKHYQLTSNPQNFAKSTWYMVGILNQTHQMNNRASNVGGYFAMPLDTWVEGTLYPSFPPRWRSVIKPVNVLANVGNMQAEIATESRHLYLPSFAEIGYSINSAPYKDEVAAGANELMFSMYTATAQRRKGTFNGEGGAQTYWTRSAGATTGSGYAAIAQDGTPISDSSASSNAAVCVGLSI